MSSKKKFLFFWNISLNISLTKNYVRIKVVVYIISYNFYPTYFSVGLFFTSHKGKTFERTRFFLIFPQKYKKKSLLNKNYVHINDDYEASAVVKHSILSFIFTVYVFDNETCQVIWKELPKRANSSTLCLKTIYLWEFHWISTCILHPWAKNTVEYPTGMYILVIKSVSSSLLRYSHKSTLKTNTFDLRFTYANSQMCARAHLPFRLFIASLGSHY